MSKSWQLSIARKVGFAILRTYCFGTAPSAWPKVQDKHFPLCLRPATGGVLPYFKAKIVCTERELFSFLRGLRSLQGGIIAQPFLNLPNLVVHGTRSVLGNILGLQAFLVDRKFEGVTLTIRPHPLSCDLAERCKEFVHVLDLTGPFHFEFLYDQYAGQAWFLEMNPRLGGTTAKVFALGYDEPGWALQGYVQQNMVKKMPLQGIATSRVALTKYMVHTMQGRLTPLDYPQEPAWKRLAFVCHALMAYRDDVFSWRDIPGTFAYFWGTLKTKLVGE